MATPPVVTNTFANGLTTWITDKDNVLQSWMNPQLSKTAKFLKNHIPKLFEAIQASKPKPVFEIDCGSGEPSLRILSYKNGTIMSKKVEVNWGTFDKANSDHMKTAEISFITELVKTYPQAIFDIRATAWARLATTEKEYAELKVADRITALTAFANTEENKTHVRFSIISQKEEAEGADLSLKNMLTSDKSFAKGFKRFRRALNPQRASSVDGGNRSIQGARIAVGFGGANVKKWIADNNVDGAIKECREKLEASFDDSGPIIPGKEDVPFFAGSHLFALTKNPAVLTKLGVPHTITTKNNKPVITLQGNEWHRGINAQNVLAALDQTIAACKATYEDSSSPPDAKNAAFNDLYGLIVTSELLRLYINKRGTKVVRVGEYKNAAGEDVKMTHYQGGYIKDFVTPFFQNAANNTYKQSFLRFLARLLDI